MSWLRYPVSRRFASTEQVTGLVAALDAGAQGFGLLLSRLGDGRRGSLLDDQYDRAHLIFEALGLRLGAVAFGLDGGCNFLLADLETLLESTADQAAPDHFGSQTLFQR